MKINLAIISPNKNAYSETFIKAQIDKLSFNNYVFYGGFLPQYFKNKEILSKNFFIRTKRFLIHTIHKKKDYKYFLRRNLTQKLKKNNINVILAQYGPTGVEMLPIAKKLGIPIFVFFHGADSSSRNYMDKYKKQYIILSREADGIFLASQTLSDNLRAIGCTTEKFVVNPYQPNEKFFNNQPDFNNQKIAMVGRFTEKKAPHLSILAFNEVLKKYPEAELHIAGIGELQGACISLVTALKIEQRVFFHGVFSPEQVQQLFNNSYMFIQHSVTSENGDQEGSPVAILEASAAALPIVSTRHSGIKESVLHEKTGYLVDEFNIQKMAKYMIKLLDNPEKAKAMGQNARKHIEANYLQHFKIIEDTIKASI